jgi:hypothetical protein
LYTTNGIYWSGNGAVVQTGVSGVSAGTGVTVSTTAGVATVSIGQSVSSSATPTFTGLISAGAVIPGVNNSYTLGSSSYYWSQLYATTVSGTNIYGTLQSSSQTNINGLGTITTGTWNATTISPTYGGTGVNNGSNTLTVSGSYTLNQSVASGASPTFGGANFSSIPNGALTNSSVTVTAGTGMSGGGAVSLGGSVTLTNAGVTSLAGGTGVSASASTGGVTISIGQAVATTSTPQFAALGVGTAAPGTTGAIYATNNITAYYGSSDRRLKENVVKISGALDKVKAMSGYYFNYNHIHQDERLMGVMADEAEKSAPELVYEFTPPMVEENKTDPYKAVRYDMMGPLLLEAIKELDEKLEKITKHLGI